MIRCVILFGLLLGCPVFAANTAVPVTAGENSQLAIQAKLYKDHDAVKGLLGEEIEKGVIAIEVTVSPKGDEPFAVWRDDFVIRSDKDGQKSEPYDPGQIASGSVLTLIYTSEGGGAHAENTGPVWGPVGGGEPRRLPNSDHGFGNAPSVERATGVRSTDGGDESTNELLDRLRELQLEESEITGPVTGLLYYPLEGKHKVKQIWLHYVGQGDRIDLQFKRPK